MSESVDEAEVRMLVEEWAAAVWRQDLDGILRAHAPEIVAGSEVALAIALMRCAGKAAEDADLDFRLTVGLRKVGGRWTVVHEHHSVPAES